MKNTGVNVILGATNNTSRTAYTAARLFDQMDLEWVPVGIKDAVIFGKKILNLREHPQIENVETITLYIGPDNQIEWYDYIISLHPKRIIFNPGTENSELMALARENGIQVEIACTLVMLHTGQYNIEEVT